MTNLDFQTLESSYPMKYNVIHETWFVTRRGFLRSLPPVRREVYKAENGYVIAVRDSGVGVDTALYVDEDFMHFYKGEPEMDMILSDQGITDYAKIKSFRMEG